MLRSWGAVGLEPMDGPKATLARDHLRSVIVLLDAASAPHNIAAHVEHAIDQLERAAAFATLGWVGERPPAARTANAPSNPATKTGASYDGSDVYDNDA